MPVTRKIKGTKPETPTQYLASIPTRERREDVKAVHELIRETLPKLTPYIGYGYIAYGKYHYRYPSGREGDSCVIGLSSRAAYISLYVCGVKDGKYVAETFKKKLPKANIGKACVRFKKLADVDLSVLRQLIKDGSRSMAGEAK
jgi:Domain of unknown function (DU1801)